MSRKRQTATTTSKAESSIVDAALKNEIRDATLEINSTEIKGRKARQISNYLEDMTEEEWIRFEFYVRSHLTRNRVKDVMKEFLPVKEVDDEMAIVVSGLTKLFIGELCDNAVDVIEESNEDGNIRPSHIREAYRRLHRDGKVGVKSDMFHPFTSFPQTRTVSMDDLLSGN